MFRVAEKNDREAVTQLFSQVFGDSLEFACTVFDKFAGESNVFVACPQGKPVSALFAVPVTLMGRNGVYFYGLCTHAQARGQGMMAGLMAYARTQLVVRGKSFAVLIPAQESLFDYYAKQNFETAFVQRCIRRPIRNNLWAQAEMDSVTAKGLETLRRRYAPGAVMLEPAGYVTVMTDLYTSGLTTVSSENGYGLYFTKGDELHFVELFAQDDRAAEKLLEAARQKNGAQQAYITLGAQQNLFLGEGSRKNYGMIGFWADRFSIEDAYMRLMLDDEY